MQWIWDFDKKEYSLIVDSLNEMHDINHAFLMYQRQKQGWYYTLPERPTNYYCSYCGVGDGNTNNTRNIEHKENCPVAFVKKLEDEIGKGWRG